MAEFNPMAFFVLGQQAKMNEEEFKAKQVERQRMQALPGARRAYFEGDSSQLQAIEPKEWSLLEGQRTERAAQQQKASFEAVDRSRQEMLFRARVISGAIGRAAQDPAQWPGAVRMLESVGAVQPGQLPAQRPPMESLVGMIDQQRGVIGSLSEPKLTNDMIEILSKHGYAGQEANGLQDPAVQKDIGLAMEASREAKKKPLASVVVNNASPLTDKNVSTQQANVADADVKMNMLEQIEADIQDAGGHDEISSIVSKAGSDIQGWKSRLFKGSLTPEQEQSLGKRAKAVASLMTFSNAVIKDISGASVSVAEKERLYKSVPMPEDPSFVRKAKIAAWIRNNEIIRDAGFASLQKGIEATHKKLSLGLPENTTVGAEKQGTIITNGQEEGYLDPGRPIPEGWRAK